MNEIHHMGLRVDTRNMDIEDKTFDYLAGKLRADNRKEVVALQLEGKKVDRYANDILTLKDEAANVRVENMRTNDAVKYSTITLALYQNNIVSKEIVANDDLSGYEVPLVVRLGFALQSGWAMFMEVVLVFVNLWVFLLIGTGAWVAFRYYYKSRQAVVPKLK